MAQTTKRQIPYAGPNDAPDVPYWQQRGAERMEVLLDDLDGKFNVDAWVLCTRRSGSSDLDGNRPATRMGLDGKTVEFSGGILLSAGTGAGNTLVTINKTEHRPSIFRNAIVASSIGALVVQVNSLGAVTTATGLSTGAWVDLSSIRYATDGPTS